MSAAWIAVVGVVISASVSALLAWYTAWRTVQSDQAKRQSELALKISNMISDADENQKRAALRRFAVGLVKVMGPERHPSLGETFFLPMFSRVTIGRHEANDICLDGASVATSRWHCGFIADRGKVWIDDYLSGSGTKLNGLEISAPRQLENGDVIEFAEFKLEFRSIKENSILVQ